MKTYLTVFYITASVLTALDMAQMSLPDEALANLTIANSTGPTASLNQSLQQDEPRPPPAGSSFISTRRGRGRGYVGNNERAQPLHTI